MSILAPHIHDEVDPMWIAMVDAYKSGWYLEDTDELYRGFKITDADRVLEVGCGSAGVFTRFIARRCAHVTFTDIDPSFVQAVEDIVRNLNPTATYEGIVSDSNPLPVADASATRITCQEVLEHVDDPKRVMDELVRAGAPGALYLLTVPGEQGELLQKPFAPSRYFEHPNHVRIFSKEGFTSLVEDAGLEIVSYGGDGFFWVFWMSMHWAIERQKYKDIPAPDMPVRDTIAPPFDDNIQKWATLWVKLISTEEGMAFKKGMDAILPKSQIIIALKP
jgi:ubiquinone/menaquinone biosynthesis C-methylase UbiE